jgi:hypothetical protein
MSHLLTAGVYGYTEEQRKRGFIKHCEQRRERKLRLAQRRDQDSRWRNWEKLQLQD